MPAALFLSLQLLSHLAYVPAIAIFLYTGCNALALAGTAVIAASCNYHLCLSSGLCTVSLSWAGTLDYAAGQYAGAMFSAYLSFYNSDARMSYIVICTTFITALLPVLYNRVQTVAFLVLLIFTGAFVGPFLTPKVKAPYSNPFVDLFAYLLALCALGLLLPPVPTGSFIYDLTHPGWHVLGGIAAFLVALRVTHWFYISFHDGQFVFIYWDPWVRYHKRSPMHHVHRHVRRFLAGARH